MNALGIALVCLLTSADTSSIVSIANLSSPHFKKREVATIALAKGMPTNHMLVRLASMSTCPETANRAVRVLSDHDTEIYSMRPRTSHYWPHFDMIDGVARYKIVKHPLPLLPDMMGYKSRKELVDYYVFKCPVIEGVGPDWQTWRSGTYWYVSDLIYSGRATKQSIQDMLDAMMPTQKSWYHQVGADHPE